MEQTKELLGGKIGAVMTACGSKVKEIIKYFKKERRCHRNLQINNHDGGHIHLYLVDYKQEEIDQLIMENNNYQHAQSHER